MVLPEIEVSTYQRPRQPIASCSPGASVPGGKKKKNGEELAREVLAHFEMTVRSFYASLAKAIHQHPRRRGDESMPISGPMRSCCPLPRPRHEEQLREAGRCGMSLKPCPR